MNQPSTDHPDADLLADLAADALPREQALAVEQHVVTCTWCAGLLADAEGVRRVLRDDPVGPMPAQVAARLEAALQREALWASAQTVEAPAVTEPVGRDEALTSTGTLPKESFFDEPYPTAAIPAGSIPVSSSASPSTRLRRADRSGTQRTRRQVRSEERTRPALALLTSRPVLGIAAGLVGIAVLGAAVQQFVGNDDLTATSASAGSAGGPAAPEAAPAVPVLATGTDYSQAKLAAQAKALVGKATAFRADADKSAGTLVGGQSQTAADASGGATGGQPNAAPAPSAASTRSAAETTAANQLLRDPAALEACLTAIDSAGVRPVAVDLATYQGREAAILVLPAAAGGYEVWAVSRTCKPGADGTLLYTTVK